MTHDPEQQKGRKMFEEIIEFDRDKIEANNYDIDKINAYLDELHDVKEIRKKAEGHYVGTTCATELARFGAAIMTYLPPLLIAGTISGAVGKVIYDKVLDDRKNKEILDNIEKFIKNLKDNIKERLNKDYEKLSQEIVVTTTEILKNIKGVYINKYEIEDFMESIEKYITYLTQYVEISYNKA